MKYEVHLDYKVVAKSEDEAREKAKHYIKINAVIECVTTPGDVFNRMKKERSSAREHFVVFHLNTQNQVVKKEVVSVGTLNASLIHPREMFRSAIIEKCASVIVAHNHPSGSVEPSDQDIVVTKRLEEAGKILGIEVIDHVVVTATCYKSIKHAKVN